MKISIGCNGVSVSAPKWVNENIIQEFLFKKANWIVDKIEYFKNNGEGFLKKGDKEEYLKHKDMALRLVLRRLEYFNKIYGFEYNKVSIKNQKTRWGSCSNNRNLNFNYRIAIIPAHLADYIVVHELCHLKEFNHSKKFWDLVSREIPNYLIIRRELKNIRGLGKIEQF